ncbi:MULTISPECIES: LysR family transcriptional regulator [unclassified Aliivibrio]|jgi:DNA-binding transcriptional LysR family regulator|uniref:LysR family transcriptional regulator n=1 Tax=unclassified Aliivibrio TaxID=2645654 RepID=UPI00080E33F6|nr:MULTISPECIES: LysR family transcriptional regulator [unclassified Aliivibrio]OCH15150.1 LysR family transcriptional regulator [Aliivibrio sp. 1S165]OCH23412.1 LysR family transcriptional regulator [Aliivibrio sp. 1S128]OCH34525.1 LysR family transcriptional regulator [Aliivibrio sp. 1S175]
MYSFEQLKIFVTVCECGSFSAAARQLKRAQSGVSQSIANLEISINQELFNRKKNTPVLTEKGKALLPIAQSILHQQKYFDQKVESLERDHEYELIIAVDESLLTDSLLQILAGLANKFPVTDFEIITTSTFDVEELVKKGKAQVGIVYADGELKVDMDFFTLGHVRFLTVVSPEHELTKLSVVSDTALKGQRQLVHRSSKRKELWFSYGISSKLWYGNSHQTLIELACKGLGWTVVPEHTVMHLLEQKKLVALPVAHEFDGWLTPMGCLVSRSHGFGPVLEEVLVSLKKLNKTAL